MTRTEVSQNIGDDLLSFVATDVALDGIAVEANTDLLLTGAVDSLGVIRITQWMEDELGLEVDPADVTLDNFQTVERMLSFIERSQTDG